MICKYCDSGNVVKNGHVHGKQFYLCKNCGHKFIEPEAYPRMRTKGRVIATAIDLYFEGLSVRKVQSQIDKIFGVKVSQVTIWKWLMKYSKLVSDFVVNFTPKLSGKYHVDETVLKCRGVQKWFWEVLDEKTRFLVASQLSGNRTIKDVVKLFEESIAVAKKKPRIVYVDGLPAYEKGFNKVFWTRYKKDKVELVKKVGLRSRKSNNMVERLHGTLKDRTRVTRGLKDAKTVETLLKGWVVHYDYVREHQSLGGKTPAQASGIDIENSWHTLIRRAIKNNVQEELSAKNMSDEMKGQPLLIEVMTK